MKILLVTLEFPPTIGGVATYLGNLYRGLPHAVRVFSSRATTPFVWWMYPRWYPFYRALLRYVVRENPDEIHISHILPVGIMAWWLWKRYHIPYVIFFHGTDLRAAYAQPRKWRRVKKIVQHARRCVVNSEATARLFADLFPEMPAPYICMPGVSVPPVLGDADTIALREKYHVGRRPIILFLARLIERKGLLVAIDAFQLLLQQAAVPPVLVVVGDGPQRAVAERQVSQLQLDTHVIFTGVATDVERWAWYRTAHLFWFPAQEIAGEWEGYGITSLEAQSMGCPVIVSSVQGLPETVHSGVTGMVVAPTAEAFALASLNLLDDAHRWQNMRTAARVWAQQHSVEAQRENFIRQVLTPDV